MRFVLPLLLALLTSPIGLLANPEPCSDHPGVVHNPPLVAAKPKPVVAKPKPKTVVTKPKPKAVVTKPKPKPATTKPKSTAAHPWTKGKATIKKKPIPKVKRPSKTTLTSGASNAVKSFLDTGKIPKGASAALIKAITSAINKAGAVKPKTITHTKTVVSTAIRKVTHTVDRTKVSVQTVQLPVTETVTVTSTVSASPTAAASTPIDNSEIQDAINSALAAVDLAESGLDNSTVAALNACVTAVLEAGGLPSNYSCITSSGSDSAGLTSTLNNILEQFLGILPNKVIEAAFDSITPSLTTLLPDEQALITEIEKSIKSVTATLSGSSVTAIEQMEQCYTKAIQQNGNTSSLQCFETTSESTLQTASNAVLESFMGVLPPSLVSTVQNILNYNLGNLSSNATPSQTLAAQVQAQISNALSSVAASISGNAVSLTETLQACTAILLTTGNATAAEECITSGQAESISMTIIMGISQQFLGYAPSSFFSDLVQFSTPLLSNLTANPTGASAAQIDSAFDAFFNNAASYGPAYVSCIEQVESCVTHAIQNSGSVSSVCPGPVAGCNLMST